MAEQTNHHPSRSPRRPYRMGRRQTAVSQTRERIVAAAFDLHATVGPSRTTIRSIADRAGVQRHTVYAHFPDIDSLYEACTEHGIRSTNMPEPAPWRAIADPVGRLGIGLAELYAWYRTNDRMLANVLYDVDPTVPPPTTPDGFELRMGELFDALVDGWAIDRHRRSTFHAVVSHGMAFGTWRSLTGVGISDADAVEILMALIVGIADGLIPPARS